MITAIRRVSIYFAPLYVCAFVGSTAVGKPGSTSANTSPHGYVPPAGFVPDKETAVRIAMAVWIPIYGESHIKGERPYHATLKNGVWTVEGSLPKGWVGGVAIAEISKRDGRILRVIHER